MSVVDIVSSHLKKWPSIQMVNDTVVIPTHSLYPSGSIVNIYIDMGKNHAQISDGGGAFEELLKIGDVEGPMLKSIKLFSKRHGLSVDNRGWLMSPEISLDHLASFVAIVSSASVSAANYLIDKFNPYPTANAFKADVEYKLAAHFNEQLHKEFKYTGVEKKHTFDFMIQLNGSQQLLLDLVVPNANSINSAVVSHLDVAKLENKNIQQRIVYNADDDWKAADISVLKLGAATVKHSSIVKLARKLAA
jgi:hypothetical protein